MSKYRKVISNFLFYGGLNHDVYHSIRGRISEENRRSTNIFTLLGALAFLITGLSTSITNAGAPVVVYYSGVGVFVLMFLLNFFLGKKYLIISDIFAILFSIIILGLGIYIAYGQSQDRTTMLLPLFGLVSLVFCYRPIYLVVILTLSEVIYLIIMKGVQTQELYFVNMVNTLIFSIIGVIGGLYTLSFKHRKHEADFEKQSLLEKDTLTGLLNRYSWTKACEKITKETKPVTLCSLDVNDLKLINDTKGHIAGDELIIGAGNCIKDVFGQYGEIYRIGGDEFCVIIDKEHNKDRLRKNLDARTRYWEGKYSSDLTISLGMSDLTFEDNQTLESAIHLADIEMYKEKQKYHEKN